MALPSFEGAHPEEAIWVGTSADMLIKVSCYTVKLSLP